MTQVIEVRAYEQHAFADYQIDTSEEKQAHLKNYEEEVEESWSLINQ